MCSWLFCHSLCCACLPQQSLLDLAVEHLRRTRQLHLVSTHIFFDPVARGQPLPQFSLDVLELMKRLLNDVFSRVAIMRKWPLQQEFELIAFETEDTQFLYRLRQIIVQGAQSFNPIMSPPGGFVGAFFPITCILTPTSSPRITCTFPLSTSQNSNPNKGMNDQQNDSPTAQLHAVRPSNV
jgi:hypothetical protein